ncbi:MAG: precorrin-6Y C5,15-methyltransferase (decarboxylating) subunit CbiT [Coriobacteriales bacterium]|jgi:precorrin-6Y C5,15-methyltransferase (decarboxylating)|nr:precorrin-6Y C5,15-methyltransferase (decarboxylating) subunit CbiT [Coriobacteriales bacterium]
MDKLVIVGFGPGTLAQATGKATEVLAGADQVFSFDRISDVDPRIESLSLADLKTRLANPLPGTTAVLVSGDCSFFSAAKTLMQDFAHLYEIELVPGIGSLQYFSACIRISYDDATLISLHGRADNIVAVVAYNKKTFALTGGSNTVQSICQDLAIAGLGAVSVSVGERLSYADEKLTTGSAAELGNLVFDQLAVMYIENLQARDPHQPLIDDDFVRGDVPMTKTEVRWLSVDKLGVAPQDTVYDIGAGTGSVAVELARKAYRGQVYAIEVNPQACDLIAQNITRFGAYNLKVIYGEAPLALADLPAPDKAFIGGSSGNLNTIMRALVVKNPDVKVVINAISLQTLAEATQLLDQYGFKGIEVVCVNIAKTRRLGNYDMMMAQNPVYIISGTAPGADSTTDAAPVKSDSKTEVDSVEVSHD